MPEGSRVRYLRPPAFSWPGGFAAHIEAEPLFHVPGAGASGGRFVQRSGVPGFFPWLSACAGGRAAQDFEPG